MTTEQLLNHKPLSQTHVLKTKKNIHSLSAAVKAGQLSSVILLLNNPSLDVSDIQLKTALTLSCRYGHADICKAILERHPNLGLQFYDKDGMTLLHRAAKNGHKTVLELLCVHGCEVNCLDKFYNEPCLFVATERGDVGCVKMLLTYGARADIIGRNGSTILHRASGKGSVEMLETIWEFLKDNLELQARKTISTSQTALHEAASKGNSQVCSFLLKKGFSVEGLNFEKSTALHCASKFGSVETVDVLIGPVSLEAEDYNGRTPLHVACEMGKLNTCTTLIKSGANVHAIDKSRKTPLHKAAAAGYMEIFKLLLKSGANLKSEDSKKRNVLMEAAMQGETAMCGFILEILPALINRLDITNASALHWASGGGHCGTVDLLIGRGSIVNQLDFKKHTPFHWAASHHHLATCRALIINGAVDPRKIVGKYFPVCRKNKYRVHCSSECTPNRIESIMEPSREELDLDMETNCAVLNSTPSQTRSLKFLKFRSRFRR